MVCKYWSSEYTFPSGAMQTPRIWWASKGSRHGMVVCMPAASWTKSELGSCNVEKYFQWPFLYSKSSKYQKLLYRTSALSVTHKRPSNYWLSLACVLIPEQPGWRDASCTSWCHPQRQPPPDWAARENSPIKVTKKPSYFINSNSGELTATPNLWPHAVTLSNASYQGSPFFPTAWFTRIAIGGTNVILHQVNGRQHAVNTLQRRAKAA